MKNNISTKINMPNLKPISSDVQQKSFHMNGAEVNLCNAMPVVKKEDLKKHKKDGMETKFYRGDTSEGLVLLSVLKEKSIPYNFTYWQGNRNETIMQISFPSNKEDTIKKQWTKEMSNKPISNTKSNSTKFRAIYSEDAEIEPMQRAPEKTDIPLLKSTKKMDQIFADCIDIVQRMEIAHQGKDWAEAERLYGKLERQMGDLKEEIDASSEKIPTAYKELALMTLRSVKANADDIMLQCQQEQAKQAEQTKKPLSIADKQNNAYIMHLYAMMCMKENLEMQALLNTVSAVNEIGNATLYAQPTVESKRFAETPIKADDAVSAVIVGAKTHTGDTVGNNKSVDVDDILNNGPQTWSMDDIEEAAQHIGKEHREKVLNGFE